MGLNLDSVIKLSDAGEAPIDPITLFVALLCVCIVIGNLLEKNRWMNVSITALAIVSFFILHFKTYGVDYLFASNCI